MQLLLVDLILGVAWLVVQEISKRNHHSGRESPAEAPSASEVVGFKEKVLGCAFESVRVKSYDLRYLVPFIHYLIPVGQSFFLQFKVIKLVEFILRPEASQIRLIHNLEVRVPKGLVPFQAFVHQEKRQRKLISIRVFLENILMIPKNRPYFLTLSDSRN